MSSIALRSARIALSSLVIAAVAVQFVAGLGQPGFSVGNFFSFFTILSNLFGAMVLLLAAFDLPTDLHRRDVLRGAAAFYLIIVGAVFSVLLANLELNTIRWVNVTVHYLMPLSIAIDWCIDPPMTRVRAGDAAFWLPPLAAYVVYSLIRGALVQWYPYPFLNADNIGYANVGIYVLGMTGFAVIAAFAVMSIGNARRAHRSRTE
jgi:hypothetical protein